MHNCRYPIIATVFLSLFPAAQAANLYDLGLVGPRGTAMGGAQIAAALDGEAVFYNPALLTKTKSTQLSMAFQYTDYSIASSNNPREGEPQRMWLGDMASVVVPFEWDKWRFAAAFAHQKPMTLYALREVTGALPVIQYEYGDQGGPDVYSPAVAVQMGDRVSFGVGVNFWRGSMGEDDTRTEFEGQNLTLGLNVPLWQYYQMHKIDVAITVRTPFELEGTGAPVVETDSQPVIVDSPLKVDMPLMAGIGIMYRWANQATLAFDYEFRQFSVRKGDYGTFESVNSANSGRDRHDLRFGSEYRLEFESFTIPLRMGGYFHLSSTSSDRQLRGDPFTHGLSLGTGFNHPSFSFDVAYNLNVSTNQYEAYEMVLVENYTTSTVSIGAALNLDVFH